MYMIIKIILACYVLVTVLCLGFLHVHVPTVRNRLSYFNRFTDFIIFRGILTRFQICSVFNSETILSISDNSFWIQWAQNISLIDIPSKTIRKSTNIIGFVQTIKYRLILITPFDSYLAELQLVIKHKILSINQKFQSFSSFQSSLTRSNAFLMSSTRIKTVQQHVPKFSDCDHEDGYMSFRVVHLEFYE